MYIIVYTYHYGLSIRVLTS